VLAASFLEARGALIGLRARKRIPERVAQRGTERVDRVRAEGDRRRERPEPDIRNRSEVLIASRDREVRQELGELSARLLPGRVAVEARRLELMRGLE